MERLTKRTEIGLAYFPKCFEEPCEGMGECRDNDCSLMIDACEKLTEYEYLEEQGLLLRLPCKQGTKVFIARKCPIQNCEKCGGYRSSINCITKYGGRIFEQEFDFRRHLVPFGETVFFTYDETYCALCKQSGLTAACKDAKTGYICERYKGKTEKALKEQEGRP